MALVQNEISNPWRKSGSSIIAYVISMMIAFVVYSVFQLYLCQASNCIKDITFYCDLAANMTGI